jgi:excinuclease ABC subunit C
MVARIKQFEYIVTHSELEALILECNLIKKYKPKFNILLKDDKNYPYIKVTMNEQYPRVLMTRRMEKDGAKYFGPYSSAGAVKQTIDLIKKIFPIKSCSKVFPRDIGKGRPCLNYHIYQCLAPCQGDVNKEEYTSLMKDICNFLNGKHEEIVKRLEQQMKTASESMEFEKAAGLRDKINSLKHISEKQKIISAAMEDQDVIAFARGETDSCVQIFFVRTGKLIGREHFIIEGTGDIETGELMTSFVKQFYSSAAYIPGNSFAVGN